MSYDHDGIVSTLVQHLRTNQYSNIKADLSGFTQPEKIIWVNKNEGHIPDVTASMGGIGYVFEVETEDSISIQHTFDQFILFSAFATQKGHVFCIVVPKAVQAIAEKVVSSLNLKATIWTIG